MEDYNNLLNYVSNCDDIYCPFNEVCSVDCDECIKCYNDNKEVVL